MLVVGRPAGAQESADTRDSGGTTGIGVNSTVPTVNTLVERDGRIVTTKEVDDALNTADGTGNTQPAKPDRPEYPKLPPDVRRKLERFKIQRDRYLLEQRVLLKRLKSATDEQREAIRRTIELRRREFLERSLDLREEAVERMTTIKRELPKHREVIDSARDNLRDQIRELQQDGRKRRGEE